MLRKQLSKNIVRGLCIVLMTLAGVAFPFLDPTVMARLPLRIGDTPPRGNVTDLNGRAVRIPDDLRGKVVILHFWASGCSSCREEMPAMEALYARYDKKGLVILAVNVGQSKEAVKAFMADLKITYPILLDPDRKMAGEYEVISVPRAFILDRNGLIRFKIVGSGASMEKLNKLVSSLL